MNEEFSVLVRTKDDFSVIEEPAGKKAKEPLAKKRNIFVCLMIIKGLFGFSFSTSAIYSAFLLASGLAICILCSTAMVFSIRCTSDVLVQLASQDKTVIYTAIYSGLFVTAASVLREVYSLLFCLFVNHTLDNISVALFNSTIYTTLPISSVKINRIVDRGNRSIKELLTKLLVVIVYRMISTVIVHVQLFELDRNYLVIITLFNLLYIFISYLLLKIRIKNKILKNRYDDLYSNKIIEGISNKDSILTANTEEYETGQFERYMQKYLRVTFNDRLLVSILNVIQKFIYTVLQITAMIYLYNSVEKKDLLKFGSTLIQYIKELDKNLMEIALATKDIFVCYVDCEAYINYIDSLSKSTQPDVVPSTADACESEEDKDSAENMDVENKNENISARCSGDKKTVVEFENVGFSHTHGTKELISRFSCRIYKGEKVAIQGSSGCGKTTLLSLLLKQCAYTGTIRVNGIDISEMTKNMITEKIGIVPQESCLFNNTLIYNIEYGSSPGKERLKMVLEKTQVSEIISSKKDGLEYNVGSLGRNLSGGEKQKVFLARCLLRDTDIIILDESTSKMDSAAELKIISHLVSTDKTVIFITHSSAVASMMDRVLVLDAEKTGESESAGKKEKVVFAELDEGSPEPGKDLLLKQKKPKTLSKN
ncbi:hypothetical protein NEMIN01_1518 [Nematocida minor]|uniref:uncharacterized protein n=1 Tax=Nematocida minor TaxID=1912983 RepID=UPI002220A3D2|nr:uncharacterized protein NEMIN01_1518 [Nematocida minor]KAI5191442.1 hypothetical protein NEMIN01_1518 [Nematocida minor]